MTSELNFLTKYGLHNYVTVTRSNGASTFSIDGTETVKMISHAQDIIGEMYPGKSRVLVS